MGTIASTSAVEAMTTLDYAVIAAYMAAVVVLGSWVGRGQKSTEAYLLAGRRMGWILVCVSIIATDLSAVSYMGVPGWLYTHDLKYFTGVVLFSPLIMLLVVVVFARIYFRLKVFTVYEYLEIRFHPLARTVIAVLFLFQRGVWLAGAIYIPSLAIVTAAGLPMEGGGPALIGCILVVGLVTTFYTTLGGIKAVIWTDFLQFLVLIGGLLLMIGMLLASYQWDVTALWVRAATLTAAETHTPHTNMISWKFDLVTEAAIWGLFLHLLTYQMGTYGADQVIAQRYFTVDSFRKVAKSVIGSGFLVSGTVYALAMFGLLLVVYYQDHPELAATLTKPDQILPHFVVHALPVGVRGLIVAAILAATMSSVSGGLNSFATVGVVDLYRRLFRRAEHGSERGRLVLAKVTTALSGLLVTLAAVWISTRKTDIVETVATLASYFVGPITGIFLLGALTRRAHVGGVVIGSVAGLIVSGLHYEWEPVKSYVNWMWVAPLTCAATFATGYLLSAITPWLHRAGEPGTTPGASRRPS